MKKYKHDYKNVLGFLRPKLECKQKNEKIQT